MSSALLLMDFQNGIARRPELEPVIKAAATALDAARSDAWPVIFVRVGFRPGFPEVADSNLGFGALKEAQDDAMRHDNTGTQIVAELEPRDGEHIVVKKRISAFAGSDLELILRGSGIDSLVLGGISTSGVVLSTVRLASDMDYKLTVLSDACGDSDPEVHRMLTEKVFPRQAKVTTVAEWVAAL